MPGRFTRKRSISQDIPTGPMADISFLLIVFFMVTTVFVVYRGFPVDLPRAEMIDALKQRRNLVSVWIGPAGRIMVDEFDVGLEEVGNVVYRKLQANPRIVVQVKSDRSTPYRMISGVIEELKRVNALRVSFIAKRE
ncbi:MAG: biopolymer transporter ExbD [Candidatus Latescibacteria bacterium]|nr:biopolymer transporter ExbD [Candidatus Latescibacterota bacterium]